MGSRWDRDRFDRMRYGGGGGGGGERDHFRFEERESFSPRGRDVMLEERIDKSGPRGRFEERERFIERDEYGPPRRANTSFLHEPIPPEVSRQALAPYRQPRPQFIRRQSSLDTFDRRQMVRYGDDYRLPSEMPIPLPIRRPRSPSRARFYEEREERFHDSDDEYREIKIREERRGNHRSKSRMRSRSVMRRRTSSTSSFSSFEEVDKTTKVGRKGRTKMPKRLAHKDVIVELGYPFEEEADHLVIQRALEKVHIDEIVEKSKSKIKEDKITYKYETKPDGSTKEEVKEEIKEEKKEEVKEEKKEEAAPPPPPPPPAPPVESTELVKKVTTTTTTIDPPDHHHHHQDLAVMINRSPHMSDRDIRREIRALEAEREALKLERAADNRLAKAERLRDGDWELIERESRRPKDVYRVERDRRVRTRSKAPGPKSVGLAMATLS